MCLRGHSQKYLNTSGTCKICHSERVKAARHGQKLHRVYRFRINKQALKDLGKPITVLADLMAIPRDTMQSWLHGHAHTGGQTKTTWQTAKYAAENIGVPFHTLWIEES